MREISKLRFDAFAGYARDPRLPLMGEELAWFEHADARVLGMLIRDRADNDYAGIVFARDELLQYRWTNMTVFEKSVRRARALLRPALEQAAMAPDEDHYQGHAGNKEVVDFFTPISPEERLHNDFSALVQEKSYEPARNIIEPMMRWYDDVDGNFVEQFQTSAFDARMWELYLFATLIELGFRVDRSNPAPDFVVESLRGRIAIEAATVNPTQDKVGDPIPPPPTNTPEEKRAFLREYMPIKFGSALYSKLVKEYWARPHVRGIPFAIAVEDFSAPGSLVFTRSALQVYLYGYDHDWEYNDRGKLVITPRRVTHHRWEEKEIPSGYFFLPGAENISAVIFSNSATIAKFNRMGMLAGFSTDEITMVRRGFALDHDPNAAEPKPFAIKVDDPAYSESWVEGLDVFHNPRALTPLDPSLLPGAAHIWLRPDGHIEVAAPGWHPLGSVTFVGVRKREAL